MKKLVVSFVAVLATIGIVSATLLSLSLVKSHAVQDPSNILDGTNLTYALAQFTNVTKCPVGDFSAANNSFCTESDSGKAITGWELVDVNGSSNGTTLILLSHSNDNDGCSGAGCNTTIKTLVFVTSSFDGQNTDWELIDTLVSEPNGVIEGGWWAQDKVVDAVLLARAGMSDDRPDVRWHSLQVID